MINKRKYYKKRMLKDALDINREIVFNKHQNIKSKKLNRLFWKGLYMLRLEAHNLMDFFKLGFRIYAKNEIILPYFEVVVTTKCSLKCRDCGSLIQYYKEPYDIEWPVIKQSLDRLFDNVDRVRLFGIIGGETFLYKELDKVIEYLREIKKVDAIRLFSNAVVPMPREQMLKCLRKKSVHINISNYGLPQTPKLGKYLREQGVRVNLGEQARWYDRGDMECRKRTKEELRAQFRTCYMKTCKSILNGKFFYCPRSGHAYDMGLIDTPARDYVDLFDKEQGRTEQIERILKLYYRAGYVEACNYCDVGTENCVPIPSAVQLSPKEQQKLSECSIK